MSSLFHPLNVKGVHNNVTFILTDVGLILLNTGDPSQITSTLYLGCVKFFEGVGSHHNRDTRTRRPRARHLTYSSFGLHTFVTEVTPTAATGYVETGRCMIDRVGRDCDTDGLTIYLSEMYQLRNVYFFFIDINFSNTTFPYYTCP